MFTKEGKRRISVCFGSIYGCIHVGAILEWDKTEVPAQVACNVCTIFARRIKTTSEMVALS